MTLPTITTIQVATSALPAYLARSAAILAAAGGSSPLAEINFSAATVVIGDGNTAGAGAQVPAISTLVTTGAVTHEVWRGTVVQSVTVDAANANQVDILCVVPAVDGSGNEIGPFWCTEFVITDETGTAMIAGTTLMPKLVTSNGTAVDLAFVASVALSLGAVVLTPPSAAFVTMAQVQAAWNANLPTATAPLTTADTINAQGWKDRVFGLPDVACIHYGVDSGPANALAAATLTPAIAAYAAGQVFEIVPANTTTTKTPTFAAPGLAALPIVRPDGGAVTPGSIRAGLPALIAYAPARGGFVLVNPARRPQFAAIGGAYSAQAAPTLALDDIDAAIWFGGVGAVTTSVTLPPAASFDAGESYWLQNTMPAGTDITLAVSGADQFSVGIYGEGSGVTSITLAYTETALLVSDGAACWILIGGSACARNVNGARSSLGAAGWKKIPDATAPRGYVIEQWGSATIAAADVAQTVVFPIAFPNAALGMMVTSASVASPGGGGVTGSLTSAAVWAQNAGAAVQYRVWGY